MGTLGLWVLELFAMYVTNKQTDRQTKAMLIAPFRTGGGIIVFMWCKLRMQRLLQVDSGLTDTQLNHLSLCQKGNRV